MSGIPESKHYAGFPVGGQFLAFDASSIAGRHDVKAYGMADTDSPPMSVPHLDARKLDGKPVVLLGVRPVLVGEPQQRHQHGRRRAGKPGPGEVPGQPGPPDRRRPPRPAAEVFPASQA
ncbi:hypothetical protein G6F31_020414 [Rhizopus arrhizus]|nr:hypothetical protein G6F31_020414 [Rhizopus arrhizus]